MWPKSAIWLADPDHMTPNLHIPWPLTWQQWLCILFSKENVTLDLSPSMTFVYECDHKHGYEQSPWWLADSGHVSVVLLHPAGTSEIDD